MISIMLRLIFLLILIYNHHTIDLVLYKVVNVYFRVLDFVLLKIQHGDVNINLVKVYYAAAAEPYNWCFSLTQLLTLNQDLRHNCTDSAFVFHSNMKDFYQNFLSIMDFGILTWPFKFCFSRPCILLQLYQRSTWNPRCCNVLSLLISALFLVV